MEVNGERAERGVGLNWLSYGAREYDASIGRWMSVDLLAEKYYSMSPYNYVANNPLIYVDPFGMDLYLVNNKNAGQALRDIMDLVNSAKFEGSVNITLSGTDKEGYLKVNASFGVLSSETINNDAGLSLLSDVTSSNKNYLYEVDTKITTTDRNSGSSSNILLGTPNRGEFMGQTGAAALNLSKTDRGDAPRNSDINAFIGYSQFNGLPEDIFFDAHIVVSPYAGDSRESYNSKKNIPRTWFTFHELQEAYYRTDRAEGYNSAHGKANELGLRFYRTNKGWNQSPFYPYQGWVPVRRKKK